MTTDHNLTLLGVFAHPDDESFGPGGTLAKYAAQGVDVHVCIATDGAAGSYDPELLEGYQSLAERRADELKGAVSVLNATLHKLPYRDSGMEGSEDNQNPASFYQAPLDEVAHHLVVLMRTIRPQVVVAHDPTGGYFHPDHIKVNQAVSRAWELVHDPSYVARPPSVPPNTSSLSTCFGGEAPRPLAEGGENTENTSLPPWQPTRLFWTALPRTWLRWLIRILRLFRKDPTRFGRNNDIDLTRLGTPDELIHTRIDVRDYLQLKQEASQHHASQGGGGNNPVRKLPTFIQRRLFGKETYTQAYPEEPKVKDDFFEGLW